MKNAFTLIEVLVVIAIFGVISSVSYALYTSLQTGRVIESVKQEVLQNMRLVQSRAKAGYHEAQHGVLFLGSMYTLYQGQSYVTRDVSFDMTYELPVIFYFDGLSEVNFAQKTGLPTPASGTVMIVNVIDETTSLSITINSEGLLY